ncbi:MAG TPA: GrlR family regulatory protein [Acidobacteriaceae bacterium]|jgi:hypothetical protein|nr:GrlR family regulatory protein [Acidobacteriaceae bacterium]
MDGYWLTHFRVGERHGEGIVMMRGGELLGGDLEHVWRGTWEEEDGRVYARIRIVPFVSRHEEEWMAREMPLIVTLTGTCTEDTAQLEGHPDAREELVYRVEMRRFRSMHAAEQKQAA